MAKPRLYSYVRLSHEKQSTGAALKRQLGIAHQLCVDQGLFLDEVFKLSNASDSSTLELLLKAFEGGIIEAGSWLLVEKIDTNEVDNDAVESLLLALTNHATVVTGPDCVVHEYLKAFNPSVSASASLLSKKKRETIRKRRKTYDSLVADIQRHKFGHRYSRWKVAYAIKQGGSHAWWVDVSGTGVKRHPQYFSIAKKIVCWLLAGWGLTRVIEELEAKYQPPVRSEKNNTRHRWTEAFLRNFAYSRALVGERRISVGSKVEVLEQYYPALVSEEDFVKLTQKKPARRTGTSKPKAVSLLTNVDLLFCGECKNPLSFMNNGKGREPRYRCSSRAENRCGSYWSFPTEFLDDSLIRVCGHKLWLIGTDKDKLEGEFNEAQQELVAYKTEKALLEQGKGRLNFAAVKRERLQRIDQDIQAASLQVSRLQSELDELIAPSEFAVDWDKMDGSVIDVNNRELRLKARNDIRVTIDSVYAYKTKKKGMYMFSFHFKDGSSLRAFRSKSKLLIKEAVGLNIGWCYEEQIEHILDWAEPKLEIYVR